jgi:hypothetical protein
MEVVVRNRRIHSKECKRRSSCGWLHVRAEVKIGVILLYDSHPSTRANALMMCLPAGRPARKSSVFWGSLSETTRRTAIKNSAKAITGKKAPISIEAAIASPNLVLAPVEFCPIASLRVFLIVLRGTTRSLAGFWLCLWVSFKLPRLMPRGLHHHYSRI